jgi:hypothetical protein
MTSTSDAGIIAAFKCHIRRRQLVHAQRMLDPSVTFDADPVPLLMNVESL